MPGADLRDSAGAAGAGRRRRRRHRGRGRRARRRPRRRRDRRRPGRREPSSSPAPSRDQPRRARASPSKPTAPCTSSLMRSCTGWPSGTWIDPPRRTAPDGSNFQLQHWTHTFDYALVSGAGDWRDCRYALSQCGIQSAAARRGRLGTTRRPEVCRPGVPCWRSSPNARCASARSRPRGTRPRTAAAGPPTPATGSWCGLSRRWAVPRRSSVQSGLRHLAAPQRLNLIEEPLVAADGLLHGYEIATLRTQLNLSAGRSTPTRCRCAPTPNPCNRSTRGTGCTTAGPRRWADCPPWRTCTRTGWTPPPVQRRRAAGSPPSVTPPTPRCTAGCGCSRRRAGRSGSRSCRSCCRPGSTWSRRSKSPCPPGATGLYPVRAELAATGAAIPAVVASDRRGRGRALGRAGTTTGCCGWSPTRATSTSRRARSAQLSVTVGTDAYADLTVEAHLISPWGTWEWLTPNITGDSVPARGTLELVFDVAPPAWTEPGRWWALVRIAVRRGAGVLTGGPGDGAMSAVAATVGSQVLTVADVDARERAVRAATAAARAAGTGHQRGPATATLAHPGAGRRTVVASASAGLDAGGGARRGGTAARYGRAYGDRQRRGGHAGRPGRPRRCSSRSPRASRSPTRPSSPITRATRCVSARPVTASGGWRRAPAAAALDDVRADDHRASAGRRPATRVPQVARRPDAPNSSTLADGLRASRRSTAARQHPQALMSACAKKSGS